MVRPNQEAIDTFMNITGASEAVAVQKLEAHGGDLNEAVNAHFSEGDSTHETSTATLHETSTAALQDDFMEIDDPIQDPSREPTLPQLSATRSSNPFSLLDPNLGRSLLNSAPDFRNLTPVVSHPREVREVPIEVKDGNEPSNRAGLAPTIMDVTDTAHDEQGPEVHGTVIIDDENDENNLPAVNARAGGQTGGTDGILVDNLGGSYHGPSAPQIDDIPDYSNDIEEEMIRAAIEASKREVQEGYSSQQFIAPDELGDTGPPQRHSHLEDSELAHAVSLSLKTAEQEKARRELMEKVGASQSEVHKPAEFEELGKLAAPNGRLEAGSSSIQDETEDLEEQPLVRHRPRRMSSGFKDSAKEVAEIGVSPPTSPGQIGVSPPTSPGQIAVSPPSSPGQHNNSPAQVNGNAFPSDEWGGISSEEHDEAVMLEAAMFGGIPEGTGYFAYAPHQLMRTGLDGAAGPYPRRIPRPPSPTLAAQRLLREQQDDEYLAALQADREKELKAKEEAETRRLVEQAAREAALEEERRREEELHRKLEEEQEFERQLAAKEASLPQEPASDDENAVNLLVRMPDGSRRGRRFLKSDKLQLLFDFIDVGRAVKPGTYRLVRPYPRRAFSDGERALTLNELGLTSKLEALYLELI